MLAPRELCKTDLLGASSLHIFRLLVFFPSFLLCFHSAARSGLDTDVRGHDRWLARRSILGPSNSPLFHTFITRASGRQHTLHNSQKNHTLKQCFPFLLLLQTHRMTILTLSLSLILACTMLVGSGTHMNRSVCALKT